MGRGASPPEAQRGLPLHPREHRHRRHRGCRGAEGAERVTKDDCSGKKKHLCSAKGLNQCWICIKNQTFVKKFSPVLYVLRPYSLAAECVKGAQAPWRCRRRSRSTGRPGSLTSCTLSSPGPLFVVRCPPPLKARAVLHLETNPLCSAITGSAFFIFSCILLIFSSILLHSVSRFWLRVPYFPPGGCPPH